MKLGHWDQSAAYFARERFCTHKRRSRNLTRGKIIVQNVVFDFFWKNDFVERNYSFFLKENSFYYFFYFVHHLLMYIRYMFQHESGTGIVLVRAVRLDPGEVHSAHGPKFCRLGV